MNIFDRRILVVTGKGGVGKSTVCAALGLYAAHKGLRTLVVETAGGSRMSEVFQRDDLGYTPAEVHPGLWTMSMTPQAAIEDYVVQQIRFRKLYKLVFRNRVMGPFIDAVPGLHDAVQLGKVFDLERETHPSGLPAWDLIIVDAPATGHGLTMLTSAQSMMELTRAGPLHDGVRRVHQVLADPTLTAIVLVALPEEVPVNETIDLWQRLEGLQDQVRLCVLNEVFPPPFDHTEDWPHARSALARIDRPELREALQMTDTWLTRMDRQTRARDSLRHALPTPLVDLPFAFHRDLGLDELLDMGRRIATLSRRPIPSPCPAERT